MTPKEQAEQIVGKYREKMLSPTLCEYCFECEDKNGDPTPCKAKTTAAKSCAILHCQGIIDESNYIARPELQDEEWKKKILKERQEYWQNIISEIQSL
jgi:hypothetical protein